AFARGSPATASERLGGTLASAASVCAVSLRFCSAVATDAASFARLPFACTWPCSQLRPRDTSGEAPCAWAGAVESETKAMTSARTNAYQPRGSRTSTEVLPLRVSFLECESTDRSENRATGQKYRTAGLECARTRIQ